MKKFFLICILAVAATSLSAQKGGTAAVLNLGYQSDYERLLLGVEGRLNLVQNLRFAPDLSFYFPNDHLTGLDVNLNLHYVVGLQNNLSVYPLAGIGMVNNRFSHRGHTDSSTDFGFNLGAGIDYSITAKSFVNLQAKYMFQDNDCAVISIGYGIRF